MEADVRNTRDSSVSLLGALVAAAVLAVCSSRRAPTSAPETDRIRAIERLRLRALVAADTAVADALHADDFQLINPVGETLTKAQYLGGIASGELDYLLWEPEEITVRFYGQAAVLRYRSMLEIVADGLRNPPRPHWHTDVYEKREGQWQVVWSQATVAR